MQCQMPDCALRRGSSGRGDTVKQFMLSAAFCIMLCATGATGSPTVITVGQGPGFDHGRIQYAINVAADGDHIVVFPGTYQENISLGGKNILVTSSDASRPDVVATTILDGEGRAAVVQFSGTETAACIVQGFTIRNGGYGISGQSCQARIRQNVITGNRLVGLLRCDGIIENNTITQNQHGGLSACHGTIQNNLITANPSNGLQDCHATIRSNTIIGNVATNGAGLYWCSGTIADNLISGNQAANRGGGLANCSGLIRGNRIADNVASVGGGLDKCDGTIRANTIAGNTAEWGGGLHDCQGIIENNLVAENSAMKEGGGLAECNHIIRNCTIVDNWILESWGSGGGLSHCSASIENCVLWGNTANSGAQLSLSNVPQYSCIQDWTGGGAGNIASFPCFVDQDGIDNNPAAYQDNDYLFRANSPCIDAGNPDPAENDGALPPGLGSERNDMGAQGGPNNGGWPATLPRSPDLTGTLTQVGAQGIISGKPCPLTGNITNYGNLPCNSSFWVDFHAVNEESGWRGILCNSILVEPLAIGETFDLAGLARPRNAYGGIPVGTYTVEMHVNPTYAVAEWNTSNNLIVLTGCQVLPDRPNLTVSNFDFTPDVISARGGDEIHFSGQIRNTGTRAAPFDFWVEFRVTPADGSGEAVSFVCDSCSVVAPMAPGGSIDLSAIVRTAYSLPVGLYNVGIVLDPGNTIDEQSEDDNIVWDVQKKLRVEAGITHANKWRLYR